MNTSSLCIYLCVLILFSIQSGPQSRCWSPCPSLYADKRVWVWVFCQNPSGNSTHCHQDHLVCMLSLKARGTCKLGWRPLHCLEHFWKHGLPFSFCSIFIWIIQSIFWNSFFNNNWTKTADLYNNKSCSSRVNRLITLTFNYKLYRIWDDLLISEQ